MEIFRKTVRDCLRAARDAGEETFRALFGVIFSHGDRVAYEAYEGHRVVRATYAEFRRSIEALAGSLRASGPEAIGGFVGIDLRDGPAFIRAFWAVLMAGGKPLLLNPLYPAPLRAELLCRMGARAVIADSCDYGDFRNLRRDGPDCSPDGAGEAPIWGDEVALATAMTGLEAKICVFDGRAFVRQIVGATASILRGNNWFFHSYHREIKVLAVLPLYHVFGLVAGYLWLSFFGRTIVFPRDRSPDAIRYAAIGLRATHVFAPPALFHRLDREIRRGVAGEPPKRRRRYEWALRASEAIQNVAPALGVALARRLFREAIGASLGPSVRFMISGGGFIDAGALRRINAIGYPLFNGYGATETMIAGAELRKRFRHRVSGGAGAPFAGTGYELSETGELTVRGDSLCKRIVSLGGEAEVRGSIRTGDLASIRGGALFVEGRASDVYVGEGGESVHPDFLQSLIAPARASDSMILEFRGRLRAVLEYAEAVPVDFIAAEAAEIRNSLSASPLGRAVASIHYTRGRLSGEGALKPGRAALRRRIEGGELTLYDAEARAASGGAGTPSDDPVGAWIARLFREALGVEGDIDPDAHFLRDLGGASLDYLALIGGVSDAFGVRIDLERDRDLFTVNGVRRYVSERA